MFFRRQHRNAMSQELTTNPNSRLCRLLAAIALAAVATFGLAPRVFGQQHDPATYAGMQWRLIGPHRAGRVTAVAGIPGRPAVYYFGTPGGGLWKTTNGGRVWQPIFDATHEAAIGALALAPSNPNIIYVGTGEYVEGHGVYKSTDAGATWTNVGLRDTSSISSLIIDPHDPNVGSPTSRPDAARPPFRRPGSPSVDPAGDASTSRRRAC